MLSAIRRYGIPVGIAIFAALLALAGYLWWEHTRKVAEGERGEQLTIALDRVEAGQLDAAKAPLAALADKGDDASKTAAQLLQAGILVEQGKPAEAQKAFAAVAADATAPQPYRDLATLREVALGFDAMPADQAVAKLKPLAVPGKPFFGSAGELLGAAYIKQGRNELAGPLFAAISRDKTVPVSLQRRARQMAGLLGVDAIDDVNEAANGGANGAPAPAAQ
ncbi:MAG: tetratricopeptide repeat protein [Sphingomonadales bacterium]|nr:tetratricopeptide repeat protein [Sphingomonadales bacterium]MBU3993075.1 tetratricopeptide repeat protein [Alphaproteobacteria bacterium]